jgi:hypothetical protein
MEMMVRWTKLRDEVGNCNNELCWNRVIEGCCDRSGGQMDKSL